VGTSQHATPADVGHLYLEVHQRLHRLVDDAMCLNGLSLARTKVLGQLADNGPLNQAAIAARLGLAARTVTDTVDSLERDGLAERQSDPNDRRAWMVALTSAGRAALSKALAAKSKAMERVFGALDAEQRDQFAALLQTIRTSVVPEPGEVNVR
jgi:DNA-binding MarR family transcriptional regulator